MHEKYGITTTMPNLESLVLKVPIWATRGQKVKKKKFEQLYLSSQTRWVPPKLLSHNHNAKSGKFSSKSSNFCHQGAKKTKTEMPQSVILQSLVANKVRNPTYSAHILLNVCFCTQCNSIQFSCFNKLCSCYGSKVTFSCLNHFCSYYGSK